MGKFLCKIVSKNKFIDITRDIEWVVEKTNGNGYKVYQKLFANERTYCIISGVRYFNNKLKAQAYLKKLYLIFRETGG